MRFKHRTYSCNFLWLQVYQNGDFSFFSRACVQDYKLPGLDFVIQKDTEVHIPSIGIHHDPRYYANPQMFDPDHFSREAKKNRTQCAFLGTKKSALIFDILGQSFDIFGDFCSTGCELRKFQSNLLMIPKT